MVEATRSKVGWVGLGAMGSRMAPRLAARGFLVAGFDLDAERLTAAADAGIRSTASVDALARESNVVVSMVHHDSALTEVSRQLREALPRGRFLLDMSTVSPAASAAVAEILADGGIGYLRAPVSDSTGLTEKGILSIIASGPEDIFEALRSILDCLGTRITYLGPAEEARVAKLVVNTIIAGINTSLAEALSLGNRSGLDWSAMIDLIAGSAAASPYIASKVAKLKARDWTADATVSLIAKDLDLALDLARHTGAFLPAAALSRQVLAAMEGRGQRDRDMSALVTFFEE